MGVQPGGVVTRRHRFAALKLRHNHTLSVMTNDHIRGLVQDVNTAAYGAGIHAGMGSDARIGERV